MSHGDLGPYVDLELDRAVQVLADAAGALASVEARRGTLRGELAVPDTNSFLHHPVPFDQINWNEAVGGNRGVHLVVPLLVVDELDRAKRDNDKPVSRGKPETVRTRARTTLRTLEGTFEDPAAMVMLQPAGENGPAVYAELLMDPPGHRRLPDADAELIDRAAAVRDLYGRDVTVITNDTAMLLRARAASLLARRLPKPPQPTPGETPPR
jgi:predicted ribonuclease YlaK